jgi:hypothetical protein
VQRDARGAKPNSSEIAFAESTREGKLGQPRHQGLRDGKAAREVVREQPS